MESLTADKGLVGQRRDASASKRRQDELLNSWIKSLGPCTAKSRAARTMVYVVRQVVVESQKGQERDSKWAEDKLALIINYLII